MAEEEVFFNFRTGGTCDAFTTGARACLEVTLLVDRASNVAVAWHTALVTGRVRKVEARPAAVTVFPDDVRLTPTASCHLVTDITHTAISATGTSCKEEEGNSTLSNKIMGLPFQIMYI